MNGTGLPVRSATTSRHLVDPELLAALDAMPSFSVNADTLAESRKTVSAAPVPAPPAPNTAIEERFVDGPDGTRLRLLVVTPTAVTPRGALLWMHGGGMIMARADDNEPLCRHIAETARCVVVAVDYRLAPENPYPAGLEDCHAALLWLHAAAGELGFPAERIILAGESGGGCMAAGLALLARDRQQVRPAAQVLLYPMLDDRTGTAADPEPRPHTGEFVWTRASNRFAWSAVLGREPGGTGVPEYAAPARATELAGVAPATIIVGDLDLFLGDSMRYANALTRSEVPTALHVYSGAYHGFVSFAQDAAVSKAAFTVFEEAIARRLAASTSGSP